MSGIQKIRDLMQKDKDFCEKIRAGRNTDEIVEIARAAGLELSDSNIEELADISPEDLQKVAGGQGSGFFSVVIDPDTFPR